MSMDADLENNEREGQELCTLIRVTPKRKTSTWDHMNPDQLLLT
jgi:hypothetical protein